MKEYQTPLKDQARSSDIANRRSKLSKYHKVVKKTLNASFTPASEDLSEASRESLDFSALSEISDANLKEDIAELNLLPDDCSSQTSFPSDLTPLKESTEYEKSGKIPMNLGSYVLDANVEADITVNFLRKSQSEVLNSVNAAPQYRKPLNELNNIVIKELCSLPEERDNVAELLAMKTQILFVIFLIWSIVVAFFFKFSDSSASEGHCQLKSSLLWLICF